LKISSLHATIGEGGGEVFFFRWSWRGGRTKKRRGVEAPALPPSSPAPASSPADFAVPDFASLPGFAEAAHHAAEIIGTEAGADEERKEGPRGAEGGAGGGPREIHRAAGEGALPFPSIGPHGHRRRLREKLLTRGADALADYELLEMLLFFAQPRGDTKPLAKAVINRFGSFAAVLTAPTHELFATPGLGEHAVAAFRLVQGAALRLARAEAAARPVLNNWERLMDYLNAALAREKVEQFRILFLDNRNQLIADEVQGRGTVNHTPVYPREVVKRALELHATALILVHNHPSGDPTPSREDVEMTAEVKEAARLLGIVVHDHVIVGHGRWVSLRREGLM
jgi:DNA repair protein RadC